MMMLILLMVVLCLVTVLFTACNTKYVYTGTDKTQMVIVKVVDKGCVVNYHVRKEGFSSTAEKLIISSSVNYGWVIGDVIEFHKVGD